MVRRWFSLRLARMILLVPLCAPIVGCGTTKWSDSPRTATEQLLVSDAVDRAISEIDFSALTDKNVYLDTRFIITALDQNYVISTLRQHMLASGCIIKDKPDEATYVVEVRTGSLGTNRQDLLFGVPATSLPTVGLLPMGSATIPEIALMKRTNQQGVCKIAVFAYDRMSGRPVWQSGNRKLASKAKDIWVMGAGPFQSGTIYNGTAFAGEKLDVPLVGKDDPPGTPGSDKMSVGREKVFLTPMPQVAQDKDASKVENAGYASPLPSAKAPAAPGTPATTQPATAESPKAAYTPPLPPPVVLPPPAPPIGPQGNLQSQSVLPSANPAASAAGAVQSYNWAKELLDRQKTTP